MRPVDSTVRPNLRPAGCTLQVVRREPGERPTLTLIDGGLPADEVEQREARRLHPTRRRPLEPAPDDGPEAV